MSAKILNSFHYTPYCGHAKKPQELSPPHTYLSSCLHSSPLNCTSPAPYSRLVVPSTQMLTLKSAWLFRYKHVISVGWQRPHGAGRDTTGKVHLRKSHEGPKGVAQAWLWDSSVATGWTVQGSNPGGGEIFHTCPNRPWGPPNLPCTGYGVTAGGIVARVWIWPSTPSSAEVKVRVELYLYSPSGPSWFVLGWTSLLPLPFTGIALLFL
jgi:hypothetical protein